MNWLQNEWSQSSTHIWLAGVGLELTQWSNGAIDGKTAIVAVIVGLLGIIIPQAPK